MNGPFATDGDKSSPADGNIRVLVFVGSSRTTALFQTVCDKFCRDDKPSARSVTEWTLRHMLERWEKQQLYWTIDRTYASSLVARASISSGVAALNDDTDVRNFSELVLELPAVLPGFDNEVNNLAFQMCAGIICPRCSMDVIANVVDGNADSPVSALRAEANKYARRAPLAGQTVSDVTSQGSGSTGVQVSTHNGNGVSGIGGVVTDAIAYAQHGSTYDAAVKAVRDIMAERNNFPRDLYEENGSRVLVTADGASGVLHAALAAVRQQADGNVVAVFPQRPTYHFLQAMVDLMFIRVLDMDTRTTMRRIVVLCCPNNPDGAVAASLVDRLHTDDFVIFDASTGGTCTRHASAALTTTFCASLPSAPTSPCSA